MILVTGATGLVGRHLITTLRGDGAEVRALSRRPETAGLPYGTDLAAVAAVALRGGHADRRHSLAGLPARGFALWAAEHAGDFR
ncbi:NAD-dependent epimerase/dehydratase family protein [Nonomuraea bangladeshensis]|uniref:NAD-dependent epimerase/dehydratase family protein n=1 Tax=Nonomuraea bangladeshensis TaxID=404385 RepID=UPI0031DBAA3D